MYFSKILNEIRLNGTHNPIYEFSRKSKDEIIHENISISNKFGSNPDGKDKSLPIMYWTPKMNLLMYVFLPQKDAAQNLFQKQFLIQLIFHQIQSFCDKLHFFIYTINAKAISN